MSVQITHYWQFFRASGSCVMERLHGGSTSTTNSSSSTVSHLQATATEEHHNLQQQSASVATTESIDHHFAEHYTSSGHSQNHHANSDHTFHPISASEGLQVNSKDNQIRPFFNSNSKLILLKRF